MRGEPRVVTLMVYKAMDERGKLATGRIEGGSMGRGRREGRAT